MSSKHFLPLPNLLSFLWPQSFRSDLSRLQILFFGTHHQIPISLYALKSLKQIKVEGVSLALSKEGKIKVRRPYLGIILFINYPSNDYLHAVFTFPPFFEENLDHHHGRWPKSQMMMVRLLEKSRTKPNISMWKSTIRIDPRPLGFY